MMDRFVIRKRKKLDDCETSREEECDGSVSSVSKKTTPINTQQPSTSQTVNGTEEINFISHDIGHYIGRISSESDLTKYELLKYHWKGHSDYKYPSSIHRKRNREERRSVQAVHFENYPWLVFSESKQGLFCKFCAIFVASSHVGKYKAVPAKNLVTEPLQKYSKLTGKEGNLEIHNNSTYHRDAMKRAQMFIKTFEQPNTDIRNQMNSSRQQQVEGNRARLRPIIQTILLLGRQNIPLRGHRDDGSLLDSNDEPIRNEGNFRALLRFRVDSGDDIMKNQLENSAANATYISKTTCNELITCIGEEILKSIFADVQKAKYYSIIFDETTDISHKSQLSLSIRYVLNGTVNESFLGFVDLQEEIRDQKETEKAITGVVLGQSVLNFMKKLELDLNYCVGIGCDGCSVNVSELCGAVSEIKKEAVNASLCPCRNHLLNLAISRSCDVPSIRNAVGTIEEIIAFFNASSKRHAVLRDYLGHSLTGHCKTRWVERHDSILQFKTDLLLIAEALTNISQWSDKVTATKASLLLKGISHCEFVIAIFSLSNSMAVTKPLSQFLQKKNLDVQEATVKIQMTVDVLKERRTYAEKFFAELATEAEKVLEELGTEFIIPRLAGRQQHRMNVPMETDSSPIVYWRRTVYIPLLDHIILDFEKRFNEESIKYLHLNALVPANLKVLATTEIKSSVKSIVDISGQLVASRGHNSNPDNILEQVVAEVELLRQRPDFSEMEDSSLAVLDKLREDDEFYPYLLQFYKIMATLPVSIATAERSFSTLRRLKTWLRSRMVEERLTGLALMNVHPNVYVDIDAVINRFATKKRKIEFVL